MAYGERAEIEDSELLAYSAKFSGLARGNPKSLAGSLIQAGDPITSEDHRTVCRVNLIQTDANGRVRTRALAKAIIGRAVMYCIPRSKIREARENYDAEGDWGPFSALENEAKSLFVKQLTTGEPGELLLFLLQEFVLGIPQIVAKMPNKTSTKMHYHGSDGLHAQLAANGTLELYWGESKLHESLNKALKEAFESLADYLDVSDRNKVDTDLRLIRDNMDLDDEELAKRVFLYFADETDESADVEYKAACLVGFDLSAYPTLNAKNPEVTAEIQKLINSWTTTLDRRVGKAKFERFHIELFMVPFESVAEFRIEFLGELGVDREAARALLEEREIARKAKLKQQRALKAGTGKADEND